MYGVLNPLPWGLFVLGLLICVMSVNRFHKKYPYFPDASDAHPTQTASHRPRQPGDVLENLQQSRWTP